jgi:hypothetical protein
VPNFVCETSSFFACTEACTNATRKVFVIPRRFETSFNPFMTDLANRLRDGGWGVMDATHLTSLTSSEHVDIFVFYVFKSEDFERVATWRSSLLSRFSATSDRIARAAWILLTEDVLYPNEKYVMRHVGWFDAVLARYPETDISVLTHYQMHSNRPLILFPHAATFARPLALEAKNSSVLLSGDVKDCYPLRVAALKLLPSGIVTRRSVVLARMGAVDPMVQGSAYADVLALYRIAIAGCARVGRLLWLVAKHFEIMAAGTAMLTDASAAPYLEPLGLLPGVHYLVATPETLEETLRYWLAPARREELNAVTERGQQVVLRFHMGHSRARLLNQLAAALWVAKQQQHVNSSSTKAMREASGDGNGDRACVSSLGLGACAITSLAMRGRGCNASTMGHEEL